MTLTEQALRQIREMLFLYSCLAEMALMETDGSPITEEKCVPTLEQMIHRLVQDAEGTAWVIVHRVEQFPLTIEGLWSNEETSPLAFAWFDTRADAELAIQLLNLGYANAIIPMKLYRNSRRLAP